MYTKPAFECDDRRRSVSPLLAIAQFDRQGHALMCTCALVMRLFLAAHKHSDDHIANSLFSCTSEHELTVDKALCPTGRLFHACVHAFTRELSKDGTLRWLDNITA